MGGILDLNFKIAPRHLNNGIMAHLLSYVCLERWRVWGGGENALLKMQRSAEDKKVCARTQGEQSIQEKKTRRYYRHLGNHGD